LGEHSQGILFQYWGNFLMNRLGVNGNRARRQATKRLVFSSFSGKKMCSFEEKLCFFKGKVVFFWLLKNEIPLRLVGCLGCLGSLGCLGRGDF
jgi:hypothetical protein